MSTLSIPQEGYFVERAKSNSNDGAEEATCAKSLPYSKQRSRTARLNRQDVKQTLDAHAKKLVKLV
ncbi:hypothetical protein KFK09_011591 [Dendrobium nobile]|uniref:Uncharacterized protein n=1 Tax=Dendrobium nobile TaxID=94219 RepID=A0A8T3BGC6_DENNO|nr:hypothetical protein KFK09_011591 [Dendrobium nobile]